MKIKFAGLFFLVLAVLFGVVSCGSAPTPGPEPEPAAAPPPAVVVADPDAAPPDQASIGNLNAAVERAENNRKLVMDFNGPEYFPEDWGNAESLYNRAQTGRRTATVRDVRESLALFNSAADAFNALAEKTIPRFAQDLENEVVAARGRAVNEGIEGIAPEYLWQMDDTAVEALAQYEAKDYYAARDSGFMARDGYNAIVTGVQAHNFRENALALGALDYAADQLHSVDDRAHEGIDKFEARDMAGAAETADFAHNAYRVMALGLEAYGIRVDIENRDLYRFDRSGIDAADQIILSAVNDFDNNDFASAEEKFNDANARYNRSLLLAREGQAGEFGNLATAERARALEARANVAVRAEYEAANTLFIQGAQAIQRRDFEQAANLYVRSRDMFIAVTLEALQRRRLADEAIHEAERRIAESDATAHRAELVIGGAQ